MNGPRCGSSDTRPCQPACLHVLREVQTWNYFLQKWIFLHQKEHQSCWHFSSTHEFTYCIQDISVAFLKDRSITFCGPNVKGTTKLETDNQSRFNQSPSPVWSLRISPHNVFKDWHPLITQASQKNCSLRNWMITTYCECLTKKKMLNEEKTHYSQILRWWKADLWKKKKLRVFCVVGHHQWWTVKVRTEVELLTHKRKGSWTPWLTFMRTTHCVLFLFESDM